MEFQDKCPNCGHPRDEGAAFCGNCGKPFGESKPEEQPPPPPQPPSPSVEPQSEGREKVELKYVAWEDKDNIGFFQGLWDTWKDSVFSPDTFYSKLPYRGGIGSPLLYAVIIGWIGVAISQIYGIVWSGAWSSFMAQYVDESELLFGTGLQAFTGLFSIFLAPIFIVIGLFIMAGIYHLILMIFGWNTRDFEATFRALAYAEGAMIWMAVPLCGGLIAWVWGIVMGIFGLKHMHKTTGGKAALVYLLPLILCCCLMIVLGLIFGAAIIGLIEEAAQGGYYYD